MTTIEEPDSTTAAYDTRAAVRDFNAQHAANVQRQSRYVCNTCGAAFRRKSARTRHLLVHTSDRPWRCEQCNRSFRRRDHMDRHILTHQRGEMEPQLIVPNRAAYVCNIDVPVSQLYLRHTAFQKLLQEFQTRHNRRFPKTPCSFCGVLMFLDESKWSTFDGTLQYGLCTVLHQRLHSKFGVNGERLVAVCGSCKKHPRSMPRIGPWPDELMSLPHRSRTFLSPLKLMTNLGRTQGAGDFRSNWATYRTVSGKLPQSISCPIQLTPTSRFHVRFQKPAGFGPLLGYYRRFPSIISSSSR